MATEIEKAVVLAAGAGRRMRREDTGASLSSEQTYAAATGVKALIPVGRPFLDYLLFHLAESGITRVCLVTGPDHDALQSHCVDLAPRRLAIEFAVQSRPQGTADAVGCAADFVGDDGFLAINSDNLYPIDDLARLRTAGGPATTGFNVETVLPKHRHSMERVAAMAIMSCDQHGYLSRIIEKPPVEAFSSAAGPVYVSMNCWRFSPQIFTACQRITPSSRGEYELPDAVRFSIEQLGEQYRLIPSSEEVLDLSDRGDIEPVAERLRGVEVRL